MKSYFLKLFNYDQFANKAINKAIMEAGESERAVKLMAHLLAAQQIWLSRCKGLASTEIALWPDDKADSFEKMIEDNHRDWIAFLNESRTEDFQKTIAYKNSIGNNYENLMEDILAHLINHSTHHRAQIGQQLKLAGMENLPNTDYIFYIR